MQVSSLKPVASSIGILAPSVFIEARGLLLENIEE
jgi:hypothetical protein